MKAKALICHENQRFSIEDVILKEPGSDQISIRTHFTGVSIGTEFALIQNKLSWGPYPICTGYQGTGEVEAVGSNIDNFSPGDRVYFRCNDSMELADGTKVSCVQGTHCSRIVLRPNTTHGAAKVMEGAGMDVASLYVMPAVGLYGVDMANPRMGQTTVVYGAGLIGLGVIAACSHRGCRVVAVDIHEKRLALARRMGADDTIDASSEDVTAGLKKIAPDGADCVFECTGLPECVDRAISLCRPHGSFVWQGNYGQAPVSMHFLPPHMKRLRMFFPCDDGWQPCRRAVIKNMAMGVLQWDECITHRVSFIEAPGIFKQINASGGGEIIGVVINWSGA